jgi:hypothetical protein
MSGHMSAARLDRALAFLNENGRAHCRREQTDGRPRQRWLHGPAKEAKEAKEGPSTMTEPEST